MASDEKEQIAPKDYLYNPEKVQPAAGRKKKHFIPLGETTLPKMSYRANAYQKTTQK
jgi:hypothetical protein